MNKVNGIDERKCGDDTKVMDTMKPTPSDEGIVTTTTTSTNSTPPSLQSPNPNDFVQNNETILLHFVDGRQLFAFCSRTDSRKSTIRIQKRNYTTSHCVGLPYGTILELQPKTVTVANNHNNRNDDSNSNSTQMQLVPLPPSEKLIPDLKLPTSLSSPVTVLEEAKEEKDEKVESSEQQMITESNVKTKDNRHLVDTNTAQSMDYPELLRMRLQGCHGTEIITSLLENSKTYDTKTTFAQEKYILRKQMKHQIRCRIVKCNAATITEALYQKDSKKYMNLREDTLGQILSYSNICSGGPTLVYDDNYGIVLSAICQRMNGNGCIYALYEQQQPSFTEMFQKFNLSFAQMNCIQYVHTGDIFYDSTVTATTTANENNNSTDEIDYERIERERLQWPCSLQNHTRQYLETQTSTHPMNVQNFLIKRASRFSRKLCRTTNMEAKQSLLGTTSSSSSFSSIEPSPATTGTDCTILSSSPPTGRLCDSLVLVMKYDPTTTLLQLFPYLAPSSPYVIYCEYLEPLTECFKQIQTNPALLSINLRLSNTWMREYQILPNRTHPAMSMSQSGGFILTGIKLHPVHGSHEFNEEQLKEIRDEIGGGRRARSNRKKPTTTSSTVKVGVAADGMDTDVTCTHSKKRKQPS